MLKLSRMTRKVPLRKSLYNLEVDKPVRMRSLAVLLRFVCKNKGFLVSELNKQDIGTIKGMCMNKMSRAMRKPPFCICENKDADQLRGNREADQRLCFRYIDSTIPLLSKSEISSL